MSSVLSALGFIPVAAVSIFFVPLWYSSVLPSTFATKCLSFLLVNKVSLLLVSVPINISPPLDVISLLSAPAIEGKSPPELAHLINNLVFSDSICTVGSPRLVVFSTLIPLAVVSSFLALSKYSSVAAFGLPTKKFSPVVLWRQSWELCSINLPVPVSLI